MIPPRSTFIAGLVAAIALPGAAAVLDSHERAYPASLNSPSVLYVRTPQVAERLFLSFDTIAADVYWMRAIQHHGRSLHRPAGDERFDDLWPLLDLATTLDPRFNVAYRFGAILLAEPPPNGPGRPQDAIRLLEKGLAANPARWQYAHDIGFVHYWHTGRFDAAADWFGRAGATPGAPRWLGPLAAMTRARGGDVETARTQLSALATSNEYYIRRAAERGLLQLRALEELAAIETLIEAHERATGRRPGQLGDLVTSGRLSRIPADPAGHPYVYSDIDGTVRLSDDSPLSPLPTTLRP